ncbi:J domain-containing protein [Planococcus lenghuensis]|uniref:J domain-containing protein n=1 Tax=Planococcus lenghuensis TaxID=2213202 RepID=A0A1Q2L157_9BACL|nr:tetratricopeptide repeat protein [Planococcus lenghuensis]AQQ54161.1 hypothetical protein B0X71_14305 [Planococcus lenghuensis]
MSSGNYYESLGVSETVTAVELQRAYVRMIRQYTNEAHPEEFEFYTKVYKTLKDPERRKQYDLSIQDGGQYQENIEKIQVGFRNEQYNQAMTLIRQTIKNYPDDERMLNLQAQCYFFLDMPSEAEELLLFLVEEYPQNELYLSQLASLYFSQDEFRESAALYKRLVEKDPEENNYSINLSNCFLHLGELDEACQVLENKLRMSTVTVYDFPLLSELYFLTAIKNDQRYHENIISRIESLAENAEDRKKLLQLMIDVAVGLDTDNYLLKELVQTIKKINRNSDAQVSRWIKKVEIEVGPLEEPEADPSPLPRANNQSPPRRQVHTTGDSSEPVRGSVLWAIIFGLVIAFSIEPFLGIVIGIVWYFFAGPIKSVLSCLGCLGAVLFVLAIMLDSCGL